jgi:ABC-type nickel/cobalt efflux system permease component RcnA
VSDAPNGREGSAESHSDKRQKRSITERKVRMNLRKGSMAVLLLVGMAGLPVCTFAQEAQSAKQDMKDAGQSTKDAAKDTAHATKKTSKKAAHKTKHATHKAASKTKQGAEKVQDKTQ